VKQGGRAMTPVTLHFKAERIEVETALKPDTDGARRLDIELTVDPREILNALEYEGQTDLIREFAKEVSDHDRIQYTTDCPY